MAKKPQTAMTPMIAPGSFMRHLAGLCGRRYFNIERLWFACGDPQPPRREILARSASKGNRVARSGYVDFPRLRFGLVCCVVRFATHAATIRSGGTRSVPTTLIQLHGNARISRSRALEVS